MGVLLLGLVVAYPYMLAQVGGAFDYQVDRAALSPAAEALIENSFADVDPARLRDYHVHVVGVDSGSSGTWINPKLMSWRDPFHKVKGDIYFSSCGILDRARADTEYIKRFQRLSQGLPGRFHLLAFDYHYNNAGQRDPDHSEFFTPNKYVVMLSQETPQRFVPVISIHPYRADAVERLKYWANKGIRYVKWLPNAQGMNATDVRAVSFFNAMREHNMVLLTHVGEEQAVEAKEAQALGDPLLFKAALDAGVKVIMAHSASLGDDDDLEHGGRKSSFDLFLSLMERPQYRGLLFGELSAMTQFNRLPRPLLTLLRRADLHGRLVNGSDYPLPAVNMLIQTRALARHKMINEQQRVLLNEIYRYNPLLFDYVVKRTLISPESRKGFPPQVFMTHPGLPH